MQVQIAGCTAHCHGVSQVQVASQTTTAVYAAGAAGQQASALAVNSAPQINTTTSQIQLGCVSACFGTTKSDPSTAAAAQLVLSELSSQMPPSDSASLPSWSAVEQSTVDQFSYQMQTGGPTTQTQSAVQTSASVQIAPAAAAVASGQEVVEDTEQQTWQLQIGCLFYCVDTQQVQAATQSTTTVVILAGASSSSDASTAVTVVVSQQTVWQVQIGCLAWCWDSTQSQTASIQTTIPVGT